VILWRESPGGREVFWVRRGEGLRFAGGFYAFPGGQLDERDSLVPVPGRSGEEAALLAAACRELFEETGVLLAPGAERLGQEALDDARRALLEGRVSFADLLLDKGLALDPSLLEPAGRWVTPDFLPVRFDARFYLARLPVGQQARVWPGELAAGEFVSTRKALYLWGRGEALLHPPNWWAITALDREEPPRALALLREPPEDILIEFQKGVVLAALRTPTLPPATHTNCWLVDIGDGVAVVDPGSPYSEEQERLATLLDVLARQGRPAREVWLTHHHVDHVSGVPWLAALGLPLRAHPATAGLLRISSAVQPLSDGEVLYGRWRVLHTPGHAPGHVAFLDEGTGALLAGDMVSTVSSVVIDPPEGDMRLYLRQLERLRQVGARTLYPAHGAPAPSAAAKLEEYLAHRHMRTEKVLAALVPGGTLAEVTRQSYDDTPPYLLPVAERS
jgi:glyoxylase-like metal-dependent hydrolase (beta-lactamase superfamily II)/8-oxo-dGTP pyrophosphatase MutT (NUDIX family)